MKYKSQKVGLGDITARIVADSINHKNVRLTTFELEYPRFVHAELMTHRMFSRNAASSRAIPVTKMMELVDNHPAMPIKWVTNQRGMQSHNEVNELVLNPIDDDCYRPDEVWNFAKEQMLLFAESFNKSGYHKQIVNRLLEPFQMIKVIVTATSFDNFFKLRYEHATEYSAQHEIHELARLMLKCYIESKPEYLDIGEWHLPYYENGYYKDAKNHEHSLEDAIKISCSQCAQVSYRKSDDSLEKALDIYDKLANSDPVHASAFEHCATPILTLEDNGVTHIDLDGNMYSGNFKWWNQYRQTIPNHYCDSFEVN